MNKSWYNIAVAEGSTEAEISIYGTIGAMDIGSKQFVDELKALGEVETIHLRINSPGGVINDGHVMFNALERSSAKIITHIDGQAGSMASVLSQVGEVRKMAANGMFMIHNPWAMTAGDAESLRKDADQLDKLKGLVMQAYSRSHYTPEELSELMDATTYMTADEALKAGFVDEIEGGLRAAASDYQEAAMELGFEIPAEKQISAMSKQIDALDKISTELSGKLDAKSQELVTVSAELVDARAEVEAAELAKAEAEKLVEESKATIEAKDAEIESAKEITEAAVAQKAAEITQSLTHAPVAEDDDANAKTSDALIEEYNALTDHVARREFRAKHKDQLSKLMKG